MKYYYQYIKDSFILLCLRLQPTSANAIELLYIVLCANLCVAQYTTHILYRYSQECSWNLVSYALSHSHLHDIRQSQNEILAVEP